MATAVQHRVIARLMANPTTSRATSSHTSSPVTARERVDLQGRRDEGLQLQAMMRRALLEGSDRSDLAACSVSDPAIMLRETGQVEAVFRALTCGTYYRVVATPVEHQGWSFRFAVVPRVGQGSGADLPFTTPAEHLAVLGGLWGVSLTR